MGQDLLIHEVSRSHNDAPQSVGLLWTSDLTRYNTHNRQTSMPPVGFEPTISADERQQTYALDRAVTGIGQLPFTLYKIQLIFNNSMILFLLITFLYVILTFVAIHYVNIVLPTYVFPYIVVTQEPHFLLCCTGGTSLSSAPLVFYTPSLNHANAVLSFQSTISLIMNQKH